MSEIKIDTTTLVKWASILVSAIGAWFALYYKVEKLEADWNRYDRDSLIVEFKLLQQQVSGQDVDLAAISKHVNQMSLDIQEIKTELKNND